MGQQLLGICHAWRWGDATKIADKMSGCMSQSSMRVQNMLHFESLWKKNIVNKLWYAPVLMIES